MTRIATPTDPPPARPPKSTPRSRRPSRSGTIPDEEFSAIKNAGYTDQQLVDISLAIAVTTFTNVFNRINDTAIDFPAVA